MTVRQGTSRWAFCAALACAAQWVSAACAEPLQPWQMVRSLQSVQDRIADGDRAAIPMQRKLLEMIDARLRAATPAELAEPRNWDAVMVYATAGGNPATVKALMPDLLVAADAMAAKAEAAARLAAGEEPEEAPAADHAEESAHGEPGPESHSEAENAHGSEGEDGGGADTHGASPHAAAESHGAEAPEHGGASAGTEAVPAKPGEHAETEAHGEAGHSAQASQEAQTQSRPDDHAATGAHEAASPEGHGQAEGHGGAAESAQEGAETDPVVTHSVEAASHDAPKKPSGHGGGKSKGHGDKMPAADAPASPEAQRRDLALGLFNFGRNRERYAAQALAKVDPSRERPELGAFVALIKGSLEAKNNPAGALKLFDQARLIAPGTLVEEAALRRSVSLAVSTEDRGRFLRGSSQYVRRFLRSPYASQFADAFVAGVVALQEGLDLDAVSDIASDMAPEQERVVYLRIARAAAVGNLMRLSAFASAKARAEPDAVAGDPDPRTALYSALSEITGEQPAETLKKLDALDPRRLTASDRELLEAVKTVAAETLRPPEPLSALPAATGHGDGEPASGGQEPSLQPSIAAEAPAPALPQTGAAPRFSPVPASDEADAVDARLDAARRTLADVDKLIEEAGK